MTSRYRRRLTERTIATKNIANCFLPWGVFPNRTEIIPRATKRGGSKRKLISSLLS